MASRRESEVQRLLEQLHDAKLRARQEEQSVQAEQRVQAEHRARQAAEQRAGQAEQEARDERRRTQLTTFEQFIRNAHDHLSKPLQVQNKSLSTKRRIYPNTSTTVERISLDTAASLRRSVFLLPPALHTASSSL